MKKFTALGVFILSGFSAFAMESAEDAMRAYAASHKVECFRGGKATTCPLAAIMDDLRVFAAPDDRTAIATMMTSPDMGNAVWFKTFWLRRGGDTYAVDHEINGLRGRLIDVSWKAGAALVTTEAMREGDARCCPSGRTIWLASADKAKATYASGDRR